MRNIIKKLPVHPTFILLLLWFIVCGRAADFCIFVGVVLSHELGHYVVAKKLGYKLDSFFLAPYGVSLNYREQVFENNDEIKIAIAGPLVNFSLAFLCVALWWIFPNVYNYTSTFVVQSVCLGLFNLLPAFPMDGGRIMLAVLAKFLPHDRALKTTKIFNVCFSCMFFVIFFVTCLVDFNPTFALAGIFMLLGTIESKFESKYKLIFLAKKQNKDFSRPFFMYVSAERTLGEVVKNIQQNRYTVFYVDFDDKTKVIDEKILLKLTLAYPLSSSLKDIYNKKHA